MTRQILQAARTVVLFAIGVVIVAVASALIVWALETIAAH